MPTTSANRTRDPSKKAAENLGLRPHGHRNRVSHKEICRFIERTVSLSQGVRRQRLVQNMMYKYQSPEQNSNQWPHSRGN